MNTFIKGQVMRVSIMILGGIMLSASVIGGVLVLHQIRQVRGAEASAKAVFASDTGLEYASWCFFKAGCDTGTLEVPVSCTDAEVSFDKGACFTLTSSVGAGDVQIVSHGTSADGAERVLETVFVQ